MKAKKFDQQFDAGVDLVASLDLSKARRVLQEQKRVNVDFPTWMIDSLDREASKLGVTRQSVIKVWLAERLEAGKPAARLATRARGHSLPTR
ncbi:MAG: CopG family transcriptional regulator [Burkholderiales bacterium]